MKRAARTLLGCVLLQCAEEEGGLRALARVVGLSPPTLYRILAGGAPGRHAMRALAMYLESVPIDELELWSLTEDEV